MNNNAYHDADQDTHKCIEHDADKYDDQVDDQYADDTDLKTGLHYK